MSKKIEEAEHLLKLLEDSLDAVVEEIQHEGLEQAGESAKAILPIAQRINRLSNTLATLHRQLEGIDNGLKNTELSWGRIWGKEEGR